MVRVVRNISYDLDFYDFSTIFMFMLVEFVTNLSQSCFSSNHYIQFYTNHVSHPVTISNPTNHISSLWCSIVIVDNASICVDASFINVINCCSSYCIIRTWAWHLWNIKFARNCQHGLYLSSFYFYYRSIDIRFQWLRVIGPLRFFFTRNCASKKSETLD